MEKSQQNNTTQSSNKFDLTPEEKKRLIVLMNKWKKEPNNLGIQTIKSLRKAKKTV